MRKKIKICGTEHELVSNAWAKVMYHKEFGSGIMEDIGKLQDYNIKQDELEKELEGKNEVEKEQAKGRLLMSEFDKMIDIPLQLAYVFIKCGNPQFISYQEWLSSIPELDYDWISEVTEMAINTFCGQGIIGTTETTQNEQGK
jgi:hypothetical protein